MPKQHLTDAFGVTEIEVAPEVRAIADQVAELISHPNGMKFFRDGVRDYDHRNQPPKRKTKSQEKYGKWLGFPLPKRQFQDCEKVALLAALHDVASPGEERIHQDVVLSNQPSEREIAECKFGLPYASLMGVLREHICTKSRTLAKDSPTLRRFLNQIQAKLVSDPPAPAPAIEQQPTKGQLRQEPAGGDPKKGNCRPKTEWLAVAMLEVQRHPHKFDKDIAVVAHISPSGLSRSREYQAAAKLARSPANPVSGAHRRGRLNRRIVEHGDDE